ncbi:unnamed protein product [Haemonchus placei]|uniref:Doublecortin domain-containing protein n=1 Tax=Haemonchus placei TaxID=6290 RepID=A0A0N4VYI7_HAEPC|nr:unnamed protein product [Haemonchus placei]
MTDLTCVVKLDSGAIKKLFALGGSAVLTLQDFFREDDVFIAYGNERASADDFYVISEGNRLSLIYFLRVLDRDLRNSLR